MPEKVIVHKAETYVDQGITLLASVKLSNGAEPTGTPFSRVHRRISKEFGDFSEISAGDISPTLHSPAKGTASNPDLRFPYGANSGDGFNFENTIPASSFALAGIYRVEYTFVETTGAARWKIVWEVTARSAKALV